MTRQYLHVRRGTPSSVATSGAGFFTEAVRNRTLLSKSAEVLQEMVHAYLLAGRPETLDAAMTLVARCGAEVWPLEAEDVTLARQLNEYYPTLSARHLCHLASCRRRGEGEIKTFDRAVNSVVG